MITLILSSKQIEHLLVALDGRREAVEQELWQLERWPPSTERHRRLGELKDHLAYIATIKQALEPLFNR